MTDNNLAPRFIQQGVGETLAEVLADYTDPDTRAEIDEVLAEHRR
jgi:hypothetical protein